MDRQPDPATVHASRRAFVTGVAALTGLAGLSQIPLAGSAVGAPRPHGGDYPFQLGVASGTRIPTGS